MKIKIQLALDRIEWSRCFQLIEEVREYVDLVEIGTGIIKEYGMAIVREVRQSYPLLPIVADMKICDAGQFEAIQAFQAGADCVTVMGFAPITTILEAHQAAKDYDKQVIVDLLGMTDRRKVNQLAEIGCSHFCLHVGKDEQANGIQAEKHLFALVRGLKNVEISVAGGINEKTIAHFLQYPIDQVIIGSAITGSQHPKQAAKTIKNNCQSYKAR
ncbi:3-hexulose-6-phosphate synthase [Aneurinibacillus aneurinilyticus]|uniref:3-hexulose-6-phosphate synthase n=1 Tax=Aneurinibacillus aneurinilyticus TaxID=1391 RepID=UPI0023F0A6CB|nr:3-hexulose-6-phosphate synthase [Aneurinibacillus aneurinilyticus]